MDPPSRVFEAAPPEIWSFPPAAADPGVMPWMHPRSPRMVPRGHGSGFAEVGGGHRDAASVGESTVTEQSCGIRSGNELMEYEAKCLKVGGLRDENGESKAEVEASSGICSKLTDQGAQHSEAPKQDYIHVRARRGQATDSHSLAERARREKISERMKTLQDLVPGCNKVIGKALVLDEIINYVQSLQHQVEFLSMKLEALSSQTNPSVEGFRAKDVRRTDAD